MTLSMNTFVPGLRRRSDDGERLALYSATAVRLEKQIVEIARLRSSLPRIALAGLVLAVASMAVHGLVALFFLVAALSTYGVGTYIASVHIAEDRSALDEVRRVISTLEGLQGDVTSPDARADR